MPRYIAVMQADSDERAVIQHGREKSRSGHNAYMTETHKKNSEKPDLGEIVDRVLSVYGDRLKSAHNWATMAGKNESTLRSAVKGNPTINTLHMIATAAGLTVGELLDFAGADWKTRVEARKILKEMTPQEIEALRTLLSARQEKKSQPRLPGASEASDQ